MRLHLVSISIALLLSTVGAHAATSTNACPGFIGGKASPVDADHFYALRAVEIISAGLAGDKDKLRGLVSPQAEFSIWNGDYGFSPRNDARQPERGVEALIHVARHMMPRRYSISVVQPGPIFIENLKGCHWDVTLLLVTDKIDQAYTMKFNFSDGTLTGATGKAVALFEGKIP